MAKIIQSPRRIQSPGVQITETDLTRRSPGQAPVRPGALVTGFAPFGPTDQLVKITSTQQFEAVYGLPETPAERYLYHTVDQVAQTGSDVYVSRLPYGEGGGGKSVQNYYSALLFPVLPHGETFQDAESFYILPPSSFLLSEDQYETYIRKGSVDWKQSISNVVKIDQKVTIPNKEVKKIFIDICNDLRVTDIDTVSSWYGTTFTTDTFKGPITLPGQVSTISRPLTSFNVNRAFVTRLQTYIDEKVQSDNADLKYKGAPTVWADVDLDLLDIISTQEELSAIISDDTDVNTTLKDLHFNLSLYANKINNGNFTLSFPKLSSQKALYSIIDLYKCNYAPEINYWFTENIGGTIPAEFTIPTIASITVSHTEDITVDTSGVIKLTVPKNHKIVKGNIIKVSGFTGINTDLNNNTPTDSTNRAVVTNIVGDTEIYYKLSSVKTTRAAFKQAGITVEKINLLESLDFTKKLSQPFKDYIVTSILNKAKEAYPNDRFTSVNVTLNSFTDNKSISAMTKNATTNIGVLSSTVLPSNLDLAFNLNNISDITKAGIVIVNDDKLTNNDLYEGFYVALADNSDDTPYTDFQSVQSVYSVNSAVKTGVDVLGNSLVKQYFTEIPKERMTFTLTESYSSINFNSVSERMARFPAYDFSQDSFLDCLKVFMFKLNTSTNLQDSVTLDYSTAEAYVGSLYARRKQNDPRGGRLVNFCVQNKIDNNSNSRIKMLLNNKISEAGVWVDEFGMPIKKVRIAEPTKALWSTGIHQKTSLDNSNKTVGDLILKLDRSLQLCELAQNESNNIDVVCEAGLGTINASICARPDYLYFDDTLDVNIDNLSVIPKNWKEYYQYPDLVRDGYSDVVKKFRNFAQNKKDHVFISDPLRYLFVSGRNAKKVDSKTFDFVNDIFRPMSVTYAKAGRSTYMAVYANWIKRYDTSSDEFTWLPPSGFMAKVILNAKKRAPWTAPAGFNYGRLSGISDIALNPNQRQRDILYRSAYNPVVNFPRDGMVVYGQKTFINYETAFDRLNVRNLFLHLEKETTRILNRFVFEPNTITTRNRVLLRLTPLFERAKTREGLYDYRLICDERNNTPDSIDRNELRVAVYIQPVRTAEFILADFVATRTGVDLDALIG